MNELNIKSALHFIPKSIIIKDEYVRCTKNFHFADKVVLVVNCDSDIFLHPMIKSLYKNLNKDDFTLCIFDNSWTTRFPEGIYFNYGFDNIINLDNTSRNIVNYDVETEFLGSILHCKSVDFCLKYFKQEGVKDAILVDSDVLFKKNPFEVIDKNFICAGEYETDNCRIKPYFQYFNIDKLNVAYFDETRMLGITHKVLHEYDTGAAFYETLKNNNLPYKEIVIDDYITHFYGGSYIFSHKEIKKYHDIDCTKENQPQKSYELVFEWLKQNSSLYWS